MNLLLRRREMLLKHSSIQPIYQLQSPVTTENYETGVLLFEHSIDFTILCEVNANFYNWTGYQGILGLGTGMTFRVGRMTNANEYTNGASTGTTTNFYCGLAFNNTSADSDPKKAHSLFSRGSNAKAIHRFAVRYDSTALKIEGLTRTNNSPTTCWWTISEAITGNNELKLNIETGTTCEVNEITIYNTKLSDAEIAEYLA